MTLDLSATMSRPSRVILDRCRLFWRPPEMVLEAFKGRSIRGRVRLTKTSGKARSPEGCPRSRFRVAKKSRVAVLSRFCSHRAAAAAAVASDRGKSPPLAVAPDVSTLPRPHPRSDSSCRGGSRRGVVHHCTGEKPQTPISPFSCTPVATLMSSSSPCPYLSSYCVFRFFVVVLSVRKEMPGTFQRIKNNARHLSIMKGYFRQSTAGTFQSASDNRSEHVLQRNRLG